MTRYTAERLLAAGGMAEVFLARQEGADGVSRDVALKRVASHLSEDEEFAAMFATEARIASRLSHPNLVQVYEFDRDESGNLFLAMELVRGMDLHELLSRLRERGVQMDAPIATFIAEELCQGLSYVHGVGPGLVHRDVTPHNILLSNSGDVKLGDFGIVKALATATQSRTVRGKLPYMSPEQALGAHVDGRSDLFSVGVVLFEMLAGKRPFDGSAHDILGQIAHREAVPFGELNRQVSPALARVVDRLLQKSPRRRFPRAHETLRSLGRVPEHLPDGATRLARLVATLEGQGAATEPPGVAPIATGRNRTRTLLRPPRKRRLRILAALVPMILVALVTLGIVVAQRREGTGRESEEPATQEPQERRYYPVRWNHEDFSSALDLLGYLPTVQRLAQRIAPDASLGGITAYDVNSSGFATSTEEFPIYYQFNAPSRRETYLANIVVALQPDGTFLAANDQLDALSSRLEGPLRCSIPDVWKHAGLRGNDHAIVTLRQPPGAPRPSWFLVSNGMTYTVVDDCP